jgi:hypothetical protein
LFLRAQTTSHFVFRGHRSADIAASHDGPGHATTHGWVLMTETVLSQNGVRPSRRDFLTLGSFFELDLLKK